MTVDDEQMKRVASDDIPHAKRANSQVKDFASYLAHLEGLCTCKTKTEIAAGLQPQSGNEEVFERSIFRALVSSAPIDPAKNFLNCKKDYDGSALLGLLQRMPKGGVLHTHGIATGDFDVLVRAVRADGHFYVWEGDAIELVQGSIRAFGSGAEIPQGWAKAESLSEEQLYKYLTLPPGLPSVEVCWQEFGKLWDRVRDLASVAPFYYGRGKFFWEILKACHAANVMYLEIKEPVFAPWMDYDGTIVSDERILTMFRDTVDAFRAEHPGFYGARMVMTALKCQEVDDVRKVFRRSVELKKMFPDYIAGFDMAGPEDLLKPIRHYAEALNEERQCALKDGVDFPLLIHAGETNVPQASQIFDAVAVGCERIGHGFALARHPALLAEVLEAGTSLECCPISNQVLGYIANLATHPALGLFRAGVPMTISPDDPGMWRYCDVSYDFAAVTKAWSLSLNEVKALARNSILYSTLRGVQKQEALAVWEKQWDAWIMCELQTATS